jgi:hypothetical protein
MGYQINMIRWHFGMLLAGMAITCMTPARARTWHTSLGRSFEAEFEKLEGSTAIFIMPNGRRFSTPVADLSAEDRARLDGDAGRFTNELVSASFGSPWPREIRLDGPVTCRVVKEDPKTATYVYQSPSYRFICDARVTDDAVRNFSVMFESTSKFVRSLPLSMGGPAGEKNRRDVYLFSTREGYTAAGGPPGSAGVFYRTKGVVLVPMESLGLKLVGTGFSLNGEFTNKTLIHELTHQLTPGAYFVPGALGWFTEGVAEYVANTSYNWGRYQTDIHGNTIKAKVVGYGTDNKGGYAMGNKITAPPLKTFFLMPYNVFSGDNARLNYGFSLLLVNYFFHMEGGGKAERITAFLKGLHAGKQGEEALKPLLAGESYQKLEENIASSWARMGIEIQFSP